MIYPSITAVHQMMVHLLVAYQWLILSSTAVYNVKVSIYFSHTNDLSK